jgi:hypothetical protein
MVSATRAAPVICAVVTFRARFTPLRACHGAHRRASQNAPCGAREPLTAVDRLRSLGDGRHAAAANLRAARRERQPGKHFAGESAGQVTDLAGSRPLSARRSVFPRRRAVRRAACLPSPLANYLWSRSCIESDLPPQTPTAFLPAKKIVESALAGFRRPTVRVKGRTHLQEPQAKSDTLTSSP